MKLYISGYGKMGRMIEKIILSRGLEYAGWSEAVTDTDPALARECVCIDFTTPDAFKANYRFLAENFKAVVVGTTGWADIRDEVVEYFRKCGTPMVWATHEGPKGGPGMQEMLYPTSYIKSKYTAPDSCFAY